MFLAMHFDWECGHWHYASAGEAIKMAILSWLACAAILLLAYVFLKDR